MRTSETFKVGEHTYQVNMWHPDKAIENLTWLTKMLGDTVLGFLMQADSLKGIMEMDVDLKLLTPGVKGMLMNLEEKTVADKCKEFTAGMHCDGKKFEYAAHFMGRTGHLLRVIVCVIKAQYQDFFEGLPVEAIKSTMQTQGSDSIQVQ